LSGCYPNGRSRWFPLRLFCQAAFSIASSAQHLYRRSPGQEVLRILHFSDRRLVPPGRAFAGLR
jgi:hypothetical protein